MGRLHEGPDAYGLRRDQLRVPAGKPRDLPVRAAFPKTQRWSCGQESGRLLGVTRSSAAQLQRRPAFVPLVPGGEGAPLGSEAGDAAYQFYSEDGVSKPPRYRSSGLHSSQDASDI